MPRFAWLAGCAFLLCDIALAADSAGPPATTPIADAFSDKKASPTAAQKATESAKETPETWRQRQERLQREQQVQQQIEQLRAEANRPTAWQLQNPSGLQNRTPTEPPRGYIAPNSYFGPEQRAWSNLSAPVTMSQMPANYFSVPPVNLSNAPIAPNTYWGAANQSWSNVRIGTARPSSLGGWNIE